jgi:hypothetical protein
MAQCPSCHRDIAPFFYSVTASVFVRNLFRSPLRKIYVCRNCGEEVTMTPGSFIACQIAFALTVIPCAIVWARIYTFLTRSVALFRRLSENNPLLMLVLLWILPTLAITLLILQLLVDRYFIVYRKANEN